jgi:hypothetical protein
MLVVAALLVEEILLVVWILLVVAALLVEGILLVV